MQVDQHVAALARTPYNPASARQLIATAAGYVFSCDDFVSPTCGAHRQ